MKAARLRLLFLLTQDMNSPSGLGRFFPLARELATAGHQVCIATLHSDYESLEKRHYWKDQVEIHYVAPMHVRKHGNIKSYYSPLRLLWIATRATFHLSLQSLTREVDIIHIGKPHPMNGVAGILARRLRRRQVYLDCDDYEAGVGHFQSGWQRKSIAYFEDHLPNQVDYLTTNTHFTQNRLIDLGVPAQRIFYLSNGVDRKRFNRVDPARVASLQSQLQLADSPVVAFVGSLSRPGHPVDLLLQGFRRVLQELPKAVLLIVGGGDDYPRLQDQAKEMGMESRIRFCGRIPPDDLPHYYHLAQVSVDPVFDDGAARGRSPLKLFESWACGVPFVTADVGDRRWLLGDPPAGHLAKPGDADSLASAILTFLTDVKAADTARKRGLEQVQNYFWDVLAMTLETHYQAHLQGSGSRQAGKPAREIDDG